MDRKKYTILLIIIISFANFSVLFFVTEDCEHFFIQKKKIQQLQEFSKLYVWKDNQPLEITDLLYSTCQYLLVNKETPLEKRYIIASFLSNLY